MSNIPTNRDELRAILLNRTDITNKVPIDVLDDFIQSTKYVDGNLAHMYFGDIKECISDETFDELLTELGITKELFDNWRDYTCDRSNDFARCVPQVGSCCNPNYCHGN